VRSRKVSMYERTKLYAMVVEGAVVDVCGVLKMLENGGGGVSDTS